MRYRLLLILLPAIWIAACTSPEPSPTPQPTLQSTSPPTTQPTPTLEPTPSPTPVPKPDIGIQGQFIDPNGAEFVNWAADLGVGWIKQQVDWNSIEYEPERYRWDELDRFVDRAQSHGLKIMLSVARAPGFSRPEPRDEDGPPSDFTVFHRFMLALSSRYRGRVAAYELWNEPNLSREWRGFPLGGEAFVGLIQQGASGVREGDPNAVIVSGAPGVTGIDDKINAIDDRVYLREMIAADVADWVDAIGAHPYGAANPPDERASDPAHKASAYNNHPSFFFLDTIEDYHALLSQAGIDKPVWITEFGWPSIDRFGNVQTPGWEYAREVTEKDQAAYLLRAIELRRERPWLGPMFIWNLNVAWLLGPDRPESAYGLIRPDGSPRPAYQQLQRSGE